jgi:hypothetical protein
MATANMIHPTLEAWDAVGHLPLCTRAVIDAEQALIDAVDAAVKAIDGVEDCYSEAGSIGSRYWTIDAIGGDWSIKLRVSNHKAGKRGAENDADIVVGDSVKEIERQLAKIAAAVKASQEMAMA